MRNVSFFTLFVLFSVNLLNAGQPSLHTLPGLRQERCNDSPPSISFNFFQQKIPANESHPVTFSTSGNLPKPSVVLPEIELGFFCLFELRLEKKFKLPVNFELK